ncbi:MAG: sigma-54 dependent transcriptional regulator [Pacificimonas sp.]
MSPQVLIVDDEPAQRTVLRMIAERAGYEAVEAACGRSGLDTLASANGRIGAVILDHSMPDMSGLEMLEALRPERPELPVIMLTAHSTVKIAVDAMRAGASDFLIKPANPDKVAAALSAAMSGGAAGGELRELTEKLPLSGPSGSGQDAKAFEHVIGDAPGFRAALKVAAKAAKRNVPVLIEGESGTGKEVVAGAVHAASPRQDKPLVIVNCGAIPANLVESVLFGHEKGAFTGATARHSGRFEEAHGGTLFLDEVGELPQDAQVKLLRALQTGQIEPVGGSGHKMVDVRIVAATNRDLKAEVAAGRFREDLYYRLGVVPITIPPLRERREDVPALARHFARQLHEEGDIACAEVDDHAIALLSAYDWPGNVRQLQNAIFRAGVLCDGGSLGLKDFPEIARQNGTFIIPVAPKPAAPCAAADTGRAGAPMSNIAGSSDDGDNAMSAAATHGAVTEDGHIRSLAELEADHIRLALRHYRGKMTEVARRLGIGRSTLYRKLGEYALEEDGR